MMLSLVSDAMGCDGGKVTIVQYFLPTPFLATSKSQELVFVETIFYEGANRHSLIIDISTTFFAF
jgi:hypothetical protein